MSRRKRIFLGVFGFLAVGLAVLAGVLSHNTECPGAPPAAAGAEAMRAVMSRCYGPTTVLTVETVAKPVPAEDEVLVKVRAAGVNPLDYHYMRGTPYIMRLSSGIGAPSDAKTGVDFAGTVEAVGKGVTTFKPGDEVFGGKGGAFGEYVVVRESRNIVHKPDNVSFEQAAAVPIAAVTALQALRDKARVRPGQKVLINGASGGVGTFAVQIAKAMGAEVTGVSSTRNVELVRSLGADHVIDYTQQNFTTSDVRYDAIIDNVGSQSLGDMLDVLVPEGVIVIVGGQKTNNWLGPLMRPIKAQFLAPFVKPEMTMILAEMTPADLRALAELMQTGKVTPVIDRRYSLEETAAAIEYLETGRARGKVVITMP
jgi:NADPH:quinone reductase-like Zn-dependent oxidoreductase